MSEILQKAQSEQDRITGIIEADKEKKDERPLFHFASPCGWINDPNGFSFYKGECHLFAQNHPYSTQWGPMYWAHAVTKDFISWKIENIALAPDTDADRGGCFSGTAIEKDGIHLIAYTGVHEKDGITVQEQCIAKGDGKSYSKFPGNPVITSGNVPFDYERSDFRDPKIWFENGTYYLAAVLKKKGGFGALVLFESSDAEKWNFVSVMDESRDGLSGMWECPDVFSLDGKDVIVFSPQEMKADEKLGFHDGNNCVYITGTFDRKSGTFIREKRVENGYTAAQIDYGIDFYAPETVLAPDGRRIMIGWMQSWESYITPEDYLWSGMMTIPREISFKNGRLYQVPVRELDLYRKNELVGVITHCDEKQRINDLSVRHFDAEFELNIGDGEQGKFSVYIAENENFSVKLEYDAASRKLSFDRTNTINGGGKIPFRSVIVNPGQNGILKLRFVCDTNSVEIFANDGETAFSNAFFVPADAKGFSVRQGLKNVVKYTFFILR